MDSQPKVSIIIPVYNAERYIQATISSCIRQTYQNLEIIVINDGSTDSSENMVLSFEDRRLKYFNIPNAGASEARNVGLQKVSGTLVQFLDSDDVLDKGKISSQVQMYQTHGDDFLYSSSMGTVTESQMGKDEGYELYEKDFTPREYFDTLLQQFGKYITTGAWLTPRKLIDKTHGWDRGIGLNDDGEYFMRIILQSKGVIFCKGSLFYYRRDVPNSFSKQFSSKDVYEKWLCSYSSYVSHFKETFEDAIAKKLGWMALSVYYTESYPHYPDLLANCKQQMKVLGYTTPYPHGGALFVKVARLVGVQNALRLWMIKGKLIRK